MVDGAGASASAETLYAYDGRGNLASITDPDGHVTLNTYDKVGQLVAVTDALNHTRTYGYDALGNQVVATDARGGSTYQYYDKVGRVIAVRDAEDYVTETRYTVFGEVDAVTRHAARATNPADPRAAPVVAINAAADATTRFKYDRLGRVTETIDAEGYSETREYDAFGQVRRAVNKLGGVTETVHDRRGLTTHEHILVPVHDAEGVERASVITNRSEYDARGNLVAWTEGWNSAAQRRTGYTYDRADRLVETTGDAVAVVNSDFVTFTTRTPTERYAYDTRGNRIRSEDANGAVTFVYYDALDRPIARLDPLGTLSQSFLRSRRQPGDHARLEHPRRPSDRGRRPPARPARRRLSPDDHRLRRSRPPDVHQRGERNQKCVGSVRRRGAHRPVERRHRVLPAVGGRDRHSPRL